MYFGAVMAAVLLGSCGAASPGASASSSTPTTPRTTAATSRTPPPLTVGKSAWVAVSVATVWRSRTSPRPVDAPALARPAGIRAVALGHDADAAPRPQRSGGHPGTHGRTGDCGPAPPGVGQGRGARPAHAEGHPRLPGLGTDPAAHRPAAPEHNKRGHGDPADSLAAHRLGGRHACHRDQLRDGAPRGRHR